MTGGILAMALVIAVIGTVVRSRARRSRERRLPARSPDTAVPVTNYGEIDQTVAAQICSCGGPFALIGEGPLATPGRRIRMVRLECKRCTQERLLYFDLQEVVP